PPEVPGGEVVVDLEGQGALPRSHRPEREPKHPHGRRTYTAVVRLSPRAAGGSEGPDAVLVQGAGVPEHVVLEVTVEVTHRGSFVGTAGVDGMARERPAGAPRPHAVGRLTG